MGVLVTVPPEKTLVNPAPAVLPVTETLARTTIEPVAKMPPPSPPPLVVLVTAVAARTWSPPPEKEFVSPTAVLLEIVELEMLTDKF